MAPSPRPKPLRSLLEASVRLRPLLGRLRADQALTVRVRGLLPEDLAAHLEGVRTRDGALVLLTASPVWASRLRFAAPALRRAMPETRGIGVKVIPRSSPEGRDRPRRLRTISAATAQLICSMAAAQGHPELREALLRLASHSQEGQRGAQDTATGRM
jgi:hypothetical protein